LTKSKRPSNVPSSAACSTTNKLKRNSNNDENWFSYQFLFSFLPFCLIFFVVFINYFLNNSCESVLWSWFFRDSDVTSSTPQQFIIHRFNKIGSSFFQSRFIFFLSSETRQLDYWTRRIWESEQQNQTFERVWGLFFCLIVLIHTLLDP
jgi:hypothetical protein